MIVNNVFKFIFWIDLLYRRKVFEPVVNHFGGNVLEGLVRGLGGVLGFVRAKGKTTYLVALTVIFAFRAIKRTYSLVDMPWA